MNKKKIIIVGSAYPYRGGGLATFNERLCKEFVASGHECTIWTFTLQYPKILFPGKTQLSDEKPPEGISIVRKVNSINPFNWVRVGKLLAKSEAHLVIFRFWIPFIGPSEGTIARRVRKNGKTRTVAIIDNMIPHEKRIGDMALIRYFAKSVDGFVAMSHKVEQDIRLFRKDAPIAYSPHPIYDNFGDAYSKQEAKTLLGLDPAFGYLLFFGFIRDYKGLDIALEAIADERVRNLPVKLIVAGEFYSDSKPYMDLIEKRGLAGQVVLRTDFIPNSEVGQYFCASDVIVQPYKTATQSGVTQIAYHFDKPMIVTNVGGLPEIVPDGKVGYVTEVSPTSIADAIVKFYEENREEQFVAGVMEEKKRFSWRYFTEQIFELVDNINKKAK